MTDGTSQASGSSRDAESTPRVNPDLYSTAGHGEADDFGTSASSSFGGAISRPTWPGVARPAGWFLPATGEAAPPVRPGTEPVRPDAPDPDDEEPDGAPGTDAEGSGPGMDATADEPDERDPRAPAGGPAGDLPRVDQPADAWHPAPLPPAVGPTAALRGRAGGPGFVPPAGAVPGLYDPAHRSSWQLAQGVWQDSGISWEQPEPDQDEYLPDDFPGEGRPAEGRPAKGQGPMAANGHGQAAAPQPTRGWGQGPARPAPGQAHGPGPAPGQAPSPIQIREPGWLGAPTVADAPDTARPVPPAYRREAERVYPGQLERTFQGEAEAMYRAWEGSVRTASARPRMTAGQRRHAWQALRVGVPTAVIVAVGAGAVMMLTGKTNEMLATRGDQYTAPPGAGAGTASSAAGLSSDQGGPQASAFGGYPGQRGTVLVNSIASAGATQLAVGGADGHPAIWHRGRGGAWSLVSAAALSSAGYARPGAESLTGVAYGREGWIAVGDVVSGAAQHPVLLTSADGVTWHAIDGGSAFAGPGRYVSGVAASKNGYVIVGRQVDGRRTFAAMWWSADLRNWIRGDNGGLDGRLTPSQANAVAATAAGWVAVGTHGHGLMIWTTADGQHWTAYDMPMPRGSSTAFLRTVTVNGTRVVAAGNAGTPAGDIPFVMVSEDGGQHWQQIVLSAPDGLGTVTALTAAGTGFVAAGQAGPAGARHEVAWGSPDGSSWSAATPIGGGADQVTALAASGGTVTGATEQGTSPSVLTLPVP
jgi:hypothetical protein